MKLEPPPPCCEKCNEPETRYRRLNDVEIIEEGEEPKVMQLCPKCQAETEDSDED